MLILCSLDWITLSLCNCSVSSIFSWFHISPTSSFIRLTNCSPPYLLSCHIILFWTFVMFQHFYYLFLLFSGWNQSFVSIGFFNIVIVSFFLFLPDSRTPYQTSRFSSPCSMFLWSNQLFGVLYLIVVHVFSVFFNCHQFTLPIPNGYHHITFQKFNQSWVCLFLSLWDCVKKIQNVTNMRDHIISNYFDFFYGMLSVIACQ